jgi:hypothetical protein
MPILEAGSLPTITGNLTLTNVIAVSPDTKVDAVTSLTTDGIFAFSNIRPVLTGFTGIALGQPGSGPAPTTAPVTRQILIR